MRRFIRLAPLIAAVPAACSSGDNGTIQLIVGEETDTLTQSPVPASLEVDAIDSSGNSTPLATVPLPASSIDLGKQDENDAATLLVKCFDANKNLVVAGASVPLSYGALANATLPIFIQRVGEFARLPTPFSDARQAPILTSVQDQYIFVAGGSDPSLGTTTQLYDFTQFSPLSSPPSLPIVPASVAFVGTTAFLIDDAGDAVYFDFSQNVAQAVPPLAGGSFADVAGGQTVVASSGVTYIVGATRTTGTPTNMVLAIDPSDTSNADYPTGNLSWLTLSAPRFAAAATWVDAHGLVVAGGNASQAGVEVIAPSPTITGSALPFPPDPSMGAGASPILDGQHVLLAGGLTPTGADAGVRVVDLDCASNCSPTPWAGLPVPVGTAAAFEYLSNSAFLVGNELGGATHAFWLTATTATEVPTKVPHSNARAVLSPTGTVVIVGGAPEAESFYAAPPPSQ